MAAAPPAPPGPPLDANPISLKVMRLCKPSLHFDLPVPFAPITAAESEPQPGCALSAMLALPQSFGDIYLGETFSSYISLCNICPISLQHVGLKVEVQTQQRTETLADSSSAAEAIDRFTSQQKLDKIIQYELKDVGIHILICSALYTDSSGERKYFRKFFKFQVNNPLSMKSKTHVLAPLNEIVVETQLQNAMPRQIFLNSVEFRAAPQFDVTPLNEFVPSLGAPRLDSHPSEDNMPLAALTAPTAPDGSDLPKATGAGPSAAAAAAAVVSSAAAPGNPSAAADGTAADGTAKPEAMAAADKLSPQKMVPERWVGLPQFGHMAFLKAGDTQQYMFRLRGKLPPEELRKVATLGRMEVVWKTAMGEAGRLQSNTVQRKVPPVRGVEVHLTSCPSEVSLQQPFEVVCAVVNTTASEMQLQLTQACVGGLLADGLCTRNLGAFKPQSSQQLTLRLIAIEPGIQKVTGMQLVDALTEQVYEVGTLADVFVRG